MAMKTKEYYIKKHREKWNWLAENPDKEKAQWPCCVYKIKNCSCENCPLDWVITKECMDTLPVLSYYILYKEALSHAERTIYSRIIANLPEKKEI